MPNQTDPNQNSQSTNQPISQSTVPSIPTHTDLPPLPPDFASVDTPTLQSTPSEVVNDVGSAAPSDLPPMIATPKKKFGGGKIIATILGILLLVGGVGTGAYLVQQQQNLASQAKGGDRWNKQKNPNCGSGCVNDVRINQAERPEGYAGQTGIAAIIQAQKDISTDNVKNNVSMPNYNDPASRQNVVLPERPGGYSKADIAAFYTGTTYTTGNLTAGYLCGGPCASEGDTDIAGYYCPGGCPNLGSYTGTYYPVGTQTGGGGGGGGTTTTTETPTAPPSGPTASCSSVKAYSATWTLLTATDLSNLTSGTVVNFCVAGTATEGTFDMAKFTINGVVQAETTTVRPSSTDFCQSYTIPASVITFNTTAQIHHTTLGWK